MWHLELCRCCQFAVDLCLTAGRRCHAVIGLDRFLQLRDTLLSGMKHLEQAFFSIVFHVQAFDDIFQWMLVVSGKIQLLQQHFYWHTPYGATGKEYLINRQATYFTYMYVEWAFSEQYYSKFLFVNKSFTSWKFSPDFGPLFRCIVWILSFAEYAD